MRLLYNEFISLLSKRTFYLVLAMVYTISVLILYISSKTVVTPDGIAYSAAEYNEVQDAIRNSENPREYLMTQLQILSESHTVGKSSLYKLLLSQIDETEKYSEYIASINERADIMQNSILVDNTNSFYIKNLHKTKDDYNRLKNVVPSYSERNGVYLATKNISVDLLFLFLMFTIVILIITVEKPMLPLYKATVCGRRKLIAAKVRLSLILCFVLHTIMTIVIYSMALTLYPVKDYSAPIQSIFINAPLKISILQYLILAYLLRFIAYSMFISIFIYLSVKTNQVLDAIGIFGLIMGLSAFLYVSIPAYSFLNIFKYVNLFFILRPSQLLYTYTNLNCFGIPVTCLYVIIAVILIVFFLTTGITSYIYDQGKVFTKSILKFSTSFIRVTSINLYVHELWRLIVANKVIIVIIFGLVIQMLHINSANMVISKEEAYYYQYIQSVKQSSDPDVWVNQQLSTLSAGGSNEQLSAINRVIALLEHVNTMSAQGEEVSIIYDTPYKVLLMDAADRNAVNSLLIIVLIMLTILPIREQLFGKLFQTTKYGRRKLLYVKTCMLLITAGAVFITVYLPEFLSICSAYNAKDFTATIKSLSFLHNESILPNMPIYLYLIIIYFLRLLVIIGISLLAMLLSKKGIYTSLAIFSALFILPALFNVFDIAIFGYYPTNWVLNLVL